MSQAEQFVRRFLAAIERDEVVGHETQWYTPDAVQVEWPNMLLPAGATRNVDQLREAGLRGRSIVESQSYEITDIVVADDKVAVEAIFRARFRMDIAGLPRGAVMTAHFAMFFLMRDGRIARHHTYDCFDDWRS